MSKENKLTHIDENGASRMVDISNKEITERIAVAHAKVTMKPETFSLIMDMKVVKVTFWEWPCGRHNGCKKTSELIPMCHPLNLNSVKIDYTNNNLDSIEITSEVKITAKTGVEMEALTAVSVCALTIYDMCKSADKSMLISDIYLVRKSGGKSGTFRKRLKTINTPE